MGHDERLDYEAALGVAIPPFTPHAISVSLPAWRDNVGYEEGEQRVVGAMASGYPRFFIHPTIQELEQICKQKFGNHESCMLFPTNKIADECRSFIQARSSKAGSPVSARLLHFHILPGGTDVASAPVEAGRDAIKAQSIPRFADLHIVLFAPNGQSFAKQFWQHTGLGISSRLAEYCLLLLSADSSTSPLPSPTTSRLLSKPCNRHYSVKTTATKFPSPKRSGFTELTTSVDSESLESDHATYVEERYGRNLPLDCAATAKRTLRRRISGVLVCNGTNYVDSSHVCDEGLHVGPSTRGVRDVTEDDCYLFPTGMAAIWTAHYLARSVRPPAKSVCFGFPYTDTLKILQKWGLGCHFFGHGLDEDMDQLEELLAVESAADGTKPPITALFTEFPSNPLLRSADLPRLRSLADKYDFLIVVDETIGNLVNVKVLPYADIVVSSLTKVFSGYSNVMGGNLILNPHGRHYAELKKWMLSNYKDVYFDEDAIYMERNSRDFKRRIKIIDANAEAVCDFLRSRSVAGGATSPVVKEVFYPKYITRDKYEICRNKDDGAAGGFGGLFSLTFTSKTASQAFFDTLSCYKGPSLGTNFTLASPYTILAHYGELEWAAQYGVEEGLVRISVGTEDTTLLLKIFQTALQAAEDSRKNRV